MYKIKVSNRENITKIRSLMTNILSLCTGLVAIGILFFICKVNPFFAISEIFANSFGTMYGIKETITKAIPLILIGTGLTFAFRAKFWNIGAEGQLLMGALFGSWTALTFGDFLPGYIIIPMMFIAGF
ncbi:MAG: ABC transporter permease, partial [Desulfobacteraceae bacterium]|nr:ABC transporter permease [Desulfobacteraceae bacterium]